MDLENCLFLLLFLFLFYSCFFVLAFAASQNCSCFLEAIQKHRGFKHGPFLLHQNAKADSDIFRKPINLPFLATLLINSASFLFKAPKKLLSSVMMERLWKKPSLLRLRHSTVSHLAMNFNHLQTTPTGSHYWKTQSIRPIITFCLKRRSSGASGGVHLIC